MEFPWRGQQLEHSDYRYTIMDWVLYCITHLYTTSSYVSVVHACASLCYSLMLLDLPRLLVLMPAIWCQAFALHYPSLLLLSGAASARRPAPNTPTKHSNYLHLVHPRALLHLWTQTQTLGDSVSWRGSPASLQFRSEPQCTAL